MDGDDHTEEQSRSMDELGDLLLHFHTAWHEAFAMYHRYGAEFTAEHDDTTTANCIRSHMWKQVVTRFDGKSGFKLQKLQGLNLLNWEGRYVFRFKKVDGSGRHANYQTKQQRDFDDQLELPGIPPAALRLTSGYQPDPSGLMIDRIIVARPYGTSTVWAAQVNLDSGKVTWTDITPVRLPGTERMDRRRGGKG
jgi:hypothetical protein